MHVQGPWNQFGYDAGLNDEMQLNQDNWTFELTSEWPTVVVFNVWGMNPDGVPDKTRAYGDIDGDRVLDLVPPDSLATNVVKLNQPPGMPHTSWRLELNDGNLSYRTVPSGSAFRQIAVFILLALLPIVSSVLAIWAFWLSFYQVKHNKLGAMELKSFARISNVRPPFQKLGSRRGSIASRRHSISDNNVTATGFEAAMGSSNRRTVLIATMEYEIEDWDIKIKIGGLGVMARLMGQNLGHQNLIWVVVRHSIRIEFLACVWAHSLKSSIGATLTYLYHVSLVLEAWNTQSISLETLCKFPSWGKSIGFWFSTTRSATSPLSS